MKKYFKEALIGLLGIFLYFFLHKIQALPFYLFGITKIPNIVKSIYLIIYELMIIAIFLLIFNKYIIKCFKDMKKNYKKYFSECFNIYLISVMIMIISNVILTFLLNKEISTNESAIREIFKVMPIYIYLSSIIFAPIVEEIVFRGCIKKIITNKYLFVIISGLIFGFIHVKSDIHNLIDLLYLIPYCSLGFAFAYSYQKTDNIFTSMGFHFLHNGIIVSLEFLLLFFT